MTDVNQVADIENTKKHTKRLERAQAALAAAEREYQEAADVYVMSRLLRIRSGQPVEENILTGHDRVNADRRESVALSNAEIDADVRRKRRLNVIN